MTHIQSNYVFRNMDDHAGKSDLLAATNLQLQDQLDEYKERERELREVIDDYQIKLAAAASNNPEMEKKIQILEDAAVKTRTQHTMELAKLEAKLTDLKTRYDKDMQTQKKFMKERNASVKSESEAKFQLELAQTELNDLKYKLTPLQNQIDDLKREF